MKTSIITYALVWPELSTYCLVMFYGKSTHVGYLMLNPVYTDIEYYIQTNCLLEHNFSTSHSSLNVIKWFQVYYSELIMLLNFDHLFANLFQLFLF